MPDLHDVDGPMLSAAEYAEHVNSHVRTIKRWIADGKLPSATKDPFSGEWRIPRDARPVVTAQAPRQDLTSPASMPSIPGLDPHQQILLPHGFLPAPGESEPSRLEDLAEESAFLSIADAAHYLGIPQAQIMANPELFEVMNVGVNGSARVPKRVVYAFEGGR